MWPHKHETEEEREQAVKAKYSEPPRSAEYTWFPLAIVVYGWTDKREVVVDKTYWETTGRESSRSIVPVKAEATPVLQDIGQDLALVIAE